MYFKPDPFSAYEFSAPYLAFCNKSVFKCEYTEFAELLSKYLQMIQLFICNRTLIVVYIHHYVLFSTATAILPDKTETNNRQGLLIQKSDSNT